MKHAGLLCISLMVLMSVIGVLAQSTDTDSVPLVVFNPEPVGPEQQAFAQNLRDILFDYDSDVIKPSAEQALRADAQWLKDNPNFHFFIDGYADWRGDIPYNMGLAQRRADTVKEALLELGVPEDRMVVTAGWGKLYPTCAQQSEDCWSRNRRVNFEYAPAAANTSVASAK